MSSYCSIFWQLGCFLVITRHAAWARLFNIRDHNLVVLVLLYIGSGWDNLFLFSPGDIFKLASDLLLDHPPELRHAENIEEGRDSTGEDIVDVEVDIVRNLDRELYSIDAKTEKFCWNFFRTSPYSTDGGHSVQERRKLD